MPCHQQHGPRSEETCQRPEAQETTAINGVGRALKQTIFPRKRLSLGSITAQLPAYNTGQALHLGILISEGRGLEATPPQEIRKPREAYSIHSTTQGEAQAGAGWV